MRLVEARTAGRGSSKESESTEAPTKECEQLTQHIQADN